MATIGEMLVRVGLDTQQFNQNMQQLQKSLSGLGSSLTSVGSTLSLGLTAPITAFASVAVHAAASMEALTNGLNAVSPSAGFAALKLGELKQVAQLPGLGFEEAVQGQVRLQAAGVSAGLATDALQNFGNAIATVGGGKAELDGVTLALAQIATKSKISAEEINQLAERVPQIRQVMMAVYGTADTEELQDRGIAPLEFIRAITEELGKLPTVAGGAKNDLENIADAMQMMGAAIGDALLPYLRALLPDILSFIDYVKDLGEEFQKLPGWQQNVIVGLVAVAAAIGPLLVALGTLISTITALAPLLGTLGTAIGGVSLAAAGTTAAVVALGAAIALPGLLDLIDSWDNLQQSVGGVAGVFDTLWRTITEILLPPLAELLGITSETGEGVSDLAGFMGDVVSTMVSWGGEILSVLTPFGAFALMLDKVNADMQTLKGLLGPSGEELKKVNTEIASGARAMADAAMQTMGVTTATGELSPEYVKAREQAKAHRLAEEARAKALKDAKTETLKTGKITKELGVEFKVIVEEAKRYTKQVEDNEKAYIDAAIAAREFKGDISDLSDEAGELNSIVLAQTSGIKDVSELAMPAATAAMLSAKSATADLSSAFETLGITSATEYQQVADKAMAAYNVVAGSGLGTEWEKDTALLRALKAQAAAAIANGKTIPDEMAKTIAALEEKVADPNSGLPKIKGAFEGFGGEVSTILTNTVQSMADALFDGDLSWSEKAKSALKSLGKAFVSNLAEPAIEALTGDGGLVKQGLDVVIDKLNSISEWIIGLFTGGSSGAGALGSALGQAGSAIGSLFGGGTQAAINGLALPGGGDLASLGIPGLGTATGAAGQAAGAASSAGTAISAGLSTTLGAIFGGVTAVSSVVGTLFGYNGLFGAAEGDADVLNSHTLQMLNELRQARQDDWDRYNGGILHHFGEMETFADQTQQNTYWALQKIEQPDGMLERLGAIRSSVSNIDFNSFWSLAKLDNWDRFLEPNLVSMESSLRAIVTGGLSLTANVYLDSKLVAQALGDQQALQSAGA